MVFPDFYMDEIVSAQCCFVCRADFLINCSLWLIQLVFVPLSENDHFQIMEQKLIELTKENSLLRSRLDKQNNIEQKQFHPCKNQEIPLHAPHDSVIIARPNFENTANLGHNSFHTFPTTVGPPPNLTTLFPSTIFPTSSNFLNPTPTNNPTTTQMFQICHLQATLAQQVIF